MASSPSKPQSATIVAYQAQHVSYPPPALLFSLGMPQTEETARAQREGAHANGCARPLQLPIVQVTLTPINRRRAELKNSNPEEQELYSARARASQAKYRQKYVCT